jgi:predicted anti-sigma-YlaC factor YlaD
MKLMLDCRALARLLGRSQDVAPPMALRARMRLHLVSCQDCRNLDAQLGRDTHLVRSNDIHDGRW